MRRTATVRDFAGELLACEMRMGRGEVERTFLCHAVKGDVGGGEQEERIGVMEVED